MSTAFIPARYFRALLIMLRERGLELSEPLALMGETAEFVTSQKEDFLTLAQVEALVEWAVQQTGSTALGMYLGARLNLSAHGIAGYAGLCAANLGEALRVAQRFQPLVMPMTNLVVEEHPDVSHVLIEPSVVVSEPTCQVILDTTVASIYVQGRYLYPEPWQEVSAYIPYAESRYDADALKAFSDVSIHFQASELRLTIPTQLLSYPLALANEQAFNHAVRQCEALMSAIPRPGGRAEVLRQALLNGGLPLPSLEKLAQTRHVSERTLRRQLLQEGVRWRELVTEVKMALAQQFLAAGNDSITAIALRLGYNDSANFARAFRRHCGMSPSQWRQ
ncbi:MAG: hypothetical protein CMK83_04705 [Pseudomonadales bacterium]|jgi:AraC-like DNA-binding protein|uniref:helix-turn-helix domain-containing protein n=1 Tax=unclassified Ketobacter TaxID=2639109 RepID=UPI000C8AFD07|nr:MULTISPECIES: AraC family transcriptional regulator [unclassified Ketobacter]MAQ23500.1 hypothetical protein [Pseudomonadales bacterium]MEC8813353.1 AraC family transcriptional regulator ligand-binding domain-containing protein [Pseudomonadota bacterium]TNC89318.1 MAG: hypothetical protein CSH49_07975 [Alcanivorax sp.]HAG94609.1 hypothetical protein [Gammaproteobacteria bacterium]MCK5791441.1 AraC family transcriptional regulator ligand-binding domain-containing protein [Ketobacter sp.]|tara:strand:- start:18978 stop:19982 length:1005 start_codon:yes stop_codon:yes gene_type:complete